MKTISRRVFLRSTAASAAAYSFLGFQTAQTLARGGKVTALSDAAAKLGKDDRRPNVVFVLADDFGYGSLNCTGADPALVRTPNIDRLAREGIKFTQASTNVSLCSPCRYSLMTGEYPWREGGLTYGVVELNAPLLLKTDRRSLANVFQDNGYQTAMIGKWHLGYGTKQTTPETFSKDLNPGPLELGFDYHFGVPHNHGAMPNVYVENHSVYGIRSDKVSPYSRSFYGVEYWGIDAPQRVDENIEQDLTDKAIDWLRQCDRDKPFFMYFAATAIHHPITPSPYMRGMSDCGPYGDFVQDLDHSVGQLFQALEYMGVADNTLFIFAGDNGGDPGPANGPGRRAMAAGFDINAPFKGHKHTIWEGGHRVPFIARWPGYIPQSSSSDAIVSMNDVFATLTELVEGQPPRGDVAPDSFSFLEAMLKPDGASGTGRKSIINGNHGGMLAIRRGAWKYIEGKYPQATPKNRRIPDNITQPQLYNLDNDIKEEENVIEQFPEIAGKLQLELDAIRASSSERELMKNKGAAFNLPE
jgi:arylsulfatase A